MKTHQEEIQLLKFGLSLSGGITANISKWNTRRPECSIVEKYWF